MKPLSVTTLCFIFALSVCPAFADKLVRVAGGDKANFKEPIGLGSVKNGHRNLPRKEWIEESFSRW